MNENLKLVAAVAAVATANYVARYKFNKKTQTLAHHNLDLIKISQLLIKQNQDLARELSNRVKVNQFLLHQNEYLVGMLDTHDVPVTEFDRIALTYPIDTE